MSASIDERIRESLRALDRVMPDPPTFASITARGERPPSSAAPTPPQRPRGRRLVVAAVGLTGLVVVALVAVRTTHHDPHPVLSVPATAPPTAAASSSSTSPSTSSTTIASSTTVAATAPLLVVPTQRLDDDFGPGLTALDVDIAPADVTPGSPALTMRLLVNLTTDQAGRITTPAVTSDGQLAVGLSCDDDSADCLRFQPKERYWGGIVTVTMSHTAVLLTAGEHPVDVSFTADDGSVVETLTIVASGVPEPDGHFSRLATSLTGAPTPIQTVADVGRFGYDVISAFGSIWVLGKSSSTVTRIDATTGAVQATIPLDLLTSARNRLAAGVDAVYVAAGPVVRIDPATNTTTTIGGDGRPLAITTDGTRVWTAGSTGVIQQVNPDGTTSNLDAPGYPWIDLAWRDGTIWALSQQRGGAHLVAIDATTGTVTDDLPITADVDGFPVRLAADRHGLVVGVDTSGGGGRSGELLVVDPDTVTVTATIPLDSRPEGIALTGHHIWTSGAVVDRTTLQVTPIGLGFVVTRGPDGSIWATGSNGFTATLTRYAPGDRRD